MPAFRGVSPRTCDPWAFLPPQFGRPETYAVFLADSQPEWSAKKFFLNCEQLLAADRDNRTSQGPRPTGNPIGQFHPNPVVHN
jgi:hypothetical protein